MGSKCQNNFDSCHCILIGFIFLTHIYAIHPNPCTVTAQGRKFKGGDFFYGKASNENNHQRL